MFQNARKYPERHGKRIPSTIVIRKGLKMNKTQLYHAWLLINDDFPQVFFVKTG